MFEAYSLRNQQRYTEAGNIYRGLLSKNRFSNVVLVELSNLHRESKDATLVEFFKNLRANPSSCPVATEKRPQVLGVLASMYAHDGDYGKAKEIYDEIIAQFARSNAERAARLEEFYIAFHVEGDVITARQILADVVAEYPNGYDIDIAKHILAGVASVSGQTRSFSKPQSPTATKEDSKILPDKFELFANYPNPFNPSTRIQYTIPKNTTVILKVFDVIGREVATLVNESKPAGYYEVQFDASRLSSGIYFYELRAGNYRSVKKMLLMK